MIRFCTFCFFFLFAGKVYANFSGSTSFEIRQRFFNDDRFGNVNGFSEWIALEYALNVGIYEIYPGLEPILSLSYTQNRSTACVLEADAESCQLQNGAPVESEDYFRYFIIGGGIGFQYKLRSVDFYGLKPFVRSQILFRYAHVRKKTYDISESTKVEGYDLGLEVAGGLDWSIYRREHTDNELAQSFELNDFSLYSLGSYLPSGFFKSGLGSIKSTGGWALGVGIAADW